MSKDNKNPFSPNNNSKRPEFNFSWIYILVAVTFLGLTFFSWENPGKEIAYRNLQEYITKGHVDSIDIVNRNVARVYIKPDSLKQGMHFSIQKAPKGFLFGEEKPVYYVFKIGTVEQFNRDLDKLSANLPDADQVRIKPHYKEEVNWVREAISWLLPIVLMVSITMFLFRKMGAGGGGSGGSSIFNVGRSKASLIDKGAIAVTFNDVAGLEEAKEEIKEIVDFLKSPDKYTNLGAKIPRGALLVGPPGTGKTLLAKAVAGEANVPFFSLSGSDFVEMFVGVGAARVRDLFAQAKEKAPAIIFIDEIDAIGRARGKNPMQGSNDERENTLNQLLTEMDGFGTNNGVIVLAATNRADILDKALLRPGRFDREINIDLPQLKGRVEIFNVYLKKIKIDDSVEVDFLARQTPGFSGADIANLCNEAALMAARKDQKTIQKQDFLDAIDRVIGGLENRSKVYPASTRKVIAFHEAGHALVSWFLEHASEFVKVTIVPRGRAEGYAAYLPQENLLNTREHLKQQMCVTLGGRAAEELVFSEVSTGAWDDLRKVTGSAYSMVKSLGMSARLPNLNYDGLDSGEYGYGKPYSEHTARIIDEEAAAIISELYAKTKEIIKAHMPFLESIAQRLLEKEVLFKEDMEEICGARPFIQEEATSYVQQKMTKAANSVSTTNE